MRETWKTMEQNRRAALVVLAAGLILLGIFLLVAGRSGVYYMTYFLPQQEENLWKGWVVGEETTVRREVTAAGARLDVVCESGSKQFELVGDRTQFVLYADGEEIYRGGFWGEILVDSDGNPDLEIMVLAGGSEIWVTEDGRTVRQSPLLLGSGNAARLLLGEASSTRGEPAMAWAAAIVLAALVLDLWFPEWGYWWSIGRWTDNRAEPSDAYYVGRLLGQIACGIVFLVILGKGSGMFV